MPSLYDQVEPSVDESLVFLSKILDKDFGFIKQIKKIQTHYDEPKFWYYSARVNPKFLNNRGRNFQTVASGISVSSEKMALLKCLSEAVERYCNYFFVLDSISFVGSISQIKGGFIDPRLLAKFSKLQLRNEHFRKFRISDNSEFRWTDCICLNTNKVTSIPAQFIYLSYPYLKNEPSIYPSISTGAAGGSCLSAAINRGIYEIIERDSFMIYYLNKIQAPKIDLKKVDNSEVSRLNEITDRYKLKIVSLNITSDLGIPVVASIVVDRTGIGKAISIGLKSDLDPIQALLGSIEEALHTRSWIRREYESNPVNIGVSDLKKKSDFKMRGLLWYPKSTINKLNFWLKSPNRKVIKKVIKNQSGKELEILSTALAKKEYKIYYKDITIPVFGRMNYSVAKVIIPEMQPLYLNENFPLLGGDRLYSVPEKLLFNKKIKKAFNKFPHPFL